MDNRGNTIAGWVLAGCVAALGLSIASGMAFHGGRPEKMGYPIEGVEESGAGGGAAEAPIATRLATADAAKGQASFAKCAACHTITQGGANGVGPNLYATLGEAIAQGKAGFAFSEALKAKGGKWDFDTMDAWLKSPRKFADGTKMTFAGLGNAEERANVIAYLNAQGSNLPLPAAPAAGAPDAAAAAGEGSNAAAAVEGNATTGATANVVESATPAAGAPSVDPAAKERAPK
ncbi:cytochrome c family protein [Sphingomonas donggukensis]|uniref:Cytochrome c family protein n=1 Tax=Sphingomonas donggukensis TaxID=2949093 RepID=A0ABY4TRI3_9SPHN|nr:cytochrome c family protein [Sphingomonas donggukensis]URW74999.1 cytochrome c family protein [Sphingomonas donggukensis]